MFLSHHLKLLLCRRDRFLYLLRSGLTGMVSGPGSSLPSTSSFQCTDRENGKQLTSKVRNKG
jgi:hypothetical protein